MTKSNEIVAAQAVTHLLKTAQAEASTRPAPEPAGEIVPMTEVEALGLAIDCVRKAVHQAQLDQRAADLTEAKNLTVPALIRRRVKHRQRLIEALGILEGLKRRASAPAETKQSNDETEDTYNEEQ